MSIESPESPAHARAAVYERTVDGFGAVRLVRLVPDTDADLVHGWVSEERARYWGMVGHTREQVRDIYAYVDSLATHHAFLALRDGEPVALFQTYDPAADPVGECYEVLPGDFGVHLLVGGATGGQQRGFTGALLRAFTGFAFSDPATLRIVVEPDVRNEKALARLVRAGFELGPEIDKPEKRARLAFLSREAAAGQG
ncbi:GNAT family N-acetyltransferase [Streptomyces clavuligerus]|uniref:Lysine N-acyltransferase MbtK n=1 Tax=Streptomyces clavuligerus TaxID=1901 RepID=E2Q668_STRCL|nr:GNAT family N-acetyltransferase [Streptomyces clavuligerus]ANW21598.1 siderophore biosynthesis protein [Streptomyces clavuligerus]AXU16224.1 N-acetyltransferase [Streptomyces clavuligerus]EFG05228.1 Acetyltransferase, penicillin amidase [Streptomyces clavuligerus]MBY6306382.1 acetyltransferase [Streptomyces clavuligerus]QCS09004.1 N-acetyltransferase [Streptomyces clavuligerus]